MLPGLIDGHDHGGGNYVQLAETTSLHLLYCPLPRRCVGRLSQTVKYPDISGITAVSPSRKVKYLFFPGVVEEEKTSFLRQVQGRSHNRNKHSLTGIAHCARRGNATEKKRKITCGRG